ncbi:MAG: cytochrome ubiquinol oxidase subunit I [Desulfobulbaceae bacterium]|nr:cytochrome ubiquinol oxidase subunit I [Desulfobulbaceae bacterium]
MNYPVWQLDFFGGGLIIALIAVLHVYISHFAIGGGLFLVLTEMKGYREGSQPILDYTRKHTKFFLLLTLVLGAITGVGIWFTIALIAPAATSILIHNFVFGWAIEWVFFLGEIVAILIYSQTFGRMERRSHLIIGWLYFLFAWLSLFAINGIIGFMLTPGEWQHTGNFWDGIFNPAFWPALFFRTFLCLMLAGLYGFLTSTAIKEEELRLRMVRYCATWLLAPFLLFLASAWWYVQALPEPQRTWIATFSPELAPFLTIFLWGSPLLFLGGLLMAIRLPQTAKRSLAVVLLLLGITYMGAFEYIREGSRRPFTLFGHIYANSILVKDLEAVQAKGILASAKWIPQEITEENRLAVGRQLFNITCLPCHSVGGPMRDIKKMSAKYGTVYAMEAEISGQGKLIRCMPPFPGNNRERHALASYIIEGLQGRKPEAAPTPIPLNAAPLAPLPFDSEQDTYVLLAWNNLGMHSLSDADGSFSLMPPANDLFAQLIKRGPTPELVTEGVVLSFRVEPGFEKPAMQVEFWKHLPSLFGMNLPANVGLSGQGLSGTMLPEKNGKAFVAEKVPVVPYPAQGGYQPYPSFTIEAREKGTNTLLASTRMVAPVSTEMGCKTCHGGGWRKGSAGISDATAGDILSMHDRLSKTNLVALAKAGKPVLCQGCHPDSALNAPGKGTQLNLSASIHGFHANFLTGRGAEACALCHPSNPQGATRFLRGVHHDAGLDCTNCHGTLEDHALALLLAEKNSGKAGADRLMKHLKPRTTATLAGIKPRTPWQHQPDCLTCHVNFGPPEADSAFNVWTAGGDDLYRNRKDESGSIHCAACHGSTHAEYPATNPYERERDNFGPRQYQANPYPIGANRNCKVCHTIDMDTDMHHPNSLGMMRNTRE